MSVKTLEYEMIPLELVFNTEFPLYYRNKPTRTESAYYTYSERNFTIDELGTMA